MRLTGKMYGSSFEVFMKYEGRTCYVSDWVAIAYGISQSSLDAVRAAA